MAAKHIDYVALKAAMKAKGLKVSSGDYWTMEDQALYKEFQYLHGNVDSATANYGLAYTGLLPAGFPGKDSVAPVSAPVVTPAPVTPTTAPVEPVVTIPVVETPTPVVTPEPTPAPAEPTPEPTPATGESATT
jgi:hypothetical protein